MISNDPTPTAKVFRKAMNPVHPRSVRSGVVEQSIREQLTENKVTLVRQWVHVCETNETAPATLSQWGGGDEGTLPEWLRGRGLTRPPRVYNNTL